MRASVTAVATLIALLTAASLTPPTPPLMRLTASATAASSPDWLNQINVYRTAAGLSNVADQPAWDTGLQHHLTYLANTPPQYYTGPYQSMHTENPASPYYTSDGAAEAGRSDLFQGAFGWNPVDFIDGWLAAPFHAIGMLRSQLTQVAFASDPRTGDAGLDVLGGLDYSQPAATAPILFPGPGMTTDLTRFGGENPSPLESCGPQFQQQPGLPLIAMLPADPSAALTAQVTGPDGTVQSTANGGLCAVTDHTYYSSDQVYGPTGMQILQGDRAVLLIAKQPYDWGRYTATIVQPGQANISWSFITAPQGRVAGGHSYTLHVTDTHATTVFGNLTVTNPIGTGYVTVYPCQQGVPVASNANYVANQTIPNSVAASPDANGDICFFASADTDLIWDQTSESSVLPVHNAVRLLDTRSGSRPVADTVISLHVASGSQTVLGNLTVTNPQVAGFTTVFPCAAGRPLASNNNFTAGETIPNFVAAQADVNGDICLYTSAAADLIWDQTSESSVLPVHNAVRLLDTRSGSMPAADAIIQLHVAAGAQTVLGNLTVTNPQAAGFTTVFPCAAGRPLASNDNFTAGETIPNFVAAQADVNGDICLYTSAAADLIWDQTSESSVLPVHNAIRLLDTRYPHPSLG